MMRILFMNIFNTVLLYNRDKKKKLTIDQINYNTVVHYNILYIHTTMKLFVWSIIKIF